MHAVAFFDSADPGLLRANGQLLRHGEPPHELSIPYGKLNGQPYNVRMDAMLKSISDVVTSVGGRLVVSSRFGCSSLLEDGSFPNTLLVTVGHVESGGLTGPLEFFVLLTMKMRVGFGLPGVAAQYGRDVGFNWDFNP